MFPRRGREKSRREKRRAKERKEKEKKTTMQFSNGSKVKNDEVLRG